MKPLTLKNSSQQSQPELQKVSIDIAEQIADKAATRAAQEVSRENMENFNRFQEQNKVQEQIPQERDNRDSIYEDSEGGYSIDTKTEKNLMRRLLDQTLQKALDPPAPSPIEEAVTQVMGRVSSGIAEKMLGSIGGSNQIATKSSFLIDILNTAAAHGFGESLGSKIPETIQSLTNSIGQQKTQELASAATKALNQQPTNQQNNSNPDAPNAEKQKDMILALDINKPEDVSQYAKAMGLTIKAAQGMLQVHQDDILTERKAMLDNTSANADTNTTNNDIAQALNILIKEMTGMKETINNLQNKIVKIEGGETSTQERSSTQPTGKSVTLFSTPIKVDVDSIKGNVNSFFEESPSKKEEESVLEEIVDDEGKSTFKMSDEQSKKEVKEQSKKSVEKEQPKEQIKEQSKKVTETPIEAEYDKKKESDSVELVKPEKIENESLRINEKIKIEEPKIENPKIEENIVKKKIIRKLIPIKKDTSDIPSHITEHYDINNNPISEDTIK